MKKPLILCQIFEQKTLNSTNNYFILKAYSGLSDEKGKKKQFLCEVNHCMPSFIIIVFPVSYCFQLFPP